MDYKLNLITPSLYSKAGPSNCIDDTVERFAHYLKYRSDTEFNLKCKYDPVPGLAFIHSFEDFEERFLIHSEYAIILASPVSQLSLNKFIPRLLVFLTSKPIWQNRFIFVILGKVKVLSNLVVNNPIEFSEDNWGNDDEKSWISLFDLIKVKWEPHIDQLITDSSLNHQLQTKEIDINEKKTSIIEEAMLNSSQISECENSLNSSQESKAPIMPDSISVLRHQQPEYEDLSNLKTVSKITTTKSHIKNLANRSIQGSNVILEYMTFSRVESDNIANPKVFKETYTNTEESRFTLIHESEENQFKQVIETNEENATNESSLVSNNDSDSDSEQIFECPPVGGIESIEENDIEESDNEIQMNKAHQQYYEAEDDSVSEFLSTNAVGDEGRYNNSSLIELKSDKIEVSVENVRSNPDKIPVQSVPSTVSVCSPLPSEDYSTILNYNAMNRDNVNDINRNEMYDFYVRDKEREENIINTFEKISSDEERSEDKINFDQGRDISKVNDNGSTESQNQSCDLSADTVIDSNLKEKETSEESSAERGFESQVTQDNIERKESTPNEISVDTTKDKCLLMSSGFCLKETRPLEGPHEEIIRSGNNMIILQLKEDTEGKKDEISSDILLYKMSKKCLLTPSESCLTDKKLFEISYETSTSSIKDKSQVNDEEIKGTKLSMNDVMDKETSEQSSEENINSTKLKSQVNEKNPERKEDKQNEISVDTIKDQLTFSADWLKEKGILELNSEVIMSIAYDTNISQTNEKAIEGKKNKISNDILIDKIKENCLSTLNDSFLNEKEHIKVNPETNLGLVTESGMFTNDKYIEEKDNLSNKIIKDKCLLSSSGDSLEERELIQRTPKELTNLSDEEENTSNKKSDRIIKDKDSNLKDRKHSEVNFDANIRSIKDGDMITKEKNTAYNEYPSNETSIVTVKNNSFSPTIEFCLKENEIGEVSTDLDGCKSQLLPFEVNSNFDNKNQTVYVDATNSPLKEIPKGYNSSNVVFLSRNDQINDDIFLSTVPSQTNDTKTEAYNNPSILFSGLERKNSVDDNGKEILTGDINTVSVSSDNDLYNEHDLPINVLITKSEGAELENSILTEHDEESDIGNEEMVNKNKISSSENEMFYHSLLMEEDLSKNVDGSMESFCLNMDKISKTTYSVDNNALESNSIINIHSEETGSIFEHFEPENENIDIGSRIHFSSVDISANLGHQYKNFGQQEHTIEKIEEENTDDKEFTAGGSDSFYLKNSDKTFDDKGINEDLGVISITNNSKDSTAKHYSKTNITEDQDKLSNLTKSDENFEIIVKDFDSPNSNQQGHPVKHSYTGRERQSQYTNIIHISFGLLAKVRAIPALVKRIVFSESRVSLHYHNKGNSNRKEDSLERCLNSPWCVLLLFAAGTFASPYWVELTTTISQRAVEPAFLVDTISSTALHEERIIGKYNHYF